MVLVFLLKMIKVPAMYISEEIIADSGDPLLARVGLMVIVYLRTHSPKYSDDKETEFSFRVNGTSGVKRFVMQNSQISVLGIGMFRVRTTPSRDPVPIFKYSILPQATLLPLRIRLIICHTRTLITFYNDSVCFHPRFASSLQDVTFI